MNVIGVTGVIGSGKTTLCKYLEATHGFEFINADEIVHQLYKVGESGYEIIKREFGSEFVGELEVDRSSLRKFVLQDREQILRLNKLIHPLVDEIVSKKIAQLKALGKSKICVESFYFEQNGLRNKIDVLVLVDSPTWLIKKRVIERKIPKEEFDTLLTLQRLMSPRQDLIIENTSDINEFYLQIEKMLI